MNKQPTEKDDSQEVRKNSKKDAKKVLENAGREGKINDDKGWKGV